MNHFDPNGRCPICQSAWIADGDDHGRPTYVCRAGLFDINNPHYIQLTAYNDLDLMKPPKEHYWIIRHLFYGHEIWWCDDGHVNIRMAIHKFEKIEFVPPFNITYERLKKLLVFS